MVFENPENKCKGNPAIIANNPLLASTIVFQKNDHLMTQRNTIKEIAKHLSNYKNKVIWMPFYGDGRCATYLRDEGFNVIHEERDFFNWEPDHWDIIVDNPPYSCKARVIERCKTFNKPFILLLPLHTLVRKYFMKVDVDVKLLLLLCSRHHFKPIEDKTEDIIKGQGNPILPTWFAFNTTDVFPQALNYEKP